MVHVLQEVHRSLRADGVVLDVHPLPRASTVEAWRDRERVVLGSPDDRTSIAAIRAAERHLGRVIRDGLFRVGPRRWFDLRVHYPSVDAWLQRREERGAKTVIPDDLLARTRQEVGVPGTTLIINERVRATVLTRS